MPITIKNDEVEKLIREASELAGTSLTETIRQSLEVRLVQLKGKRTTVDIADELLAISRRCAELPGIDDRSEAEILGYTTEGLLPHGH